MANEKMLETNVGVGQDEVTVLFRANLDDLQRVVLEGKGDAKSVKPILEALREPYQAKAVLTGFPVGKSRGENGEPLWRKGADIQTEKGTRTPFSALFALARSWRTTLRDDTGEVIRDQSGRPVSQGQTWLFEPTIWNPGRGAHLLFAAAKAIGAKRQKAGGGSPQMGFLCPLTTGQNQAGKSYGMLEYGIQQPEGSTMPRFKGMVDSVILVAPASDRENGGGGDNRGGVLGR